MRKNIIFLYIMSNLTLNTTHPLNNREQTYFMDRKLISVHSIDRDIKKWPNANEFEILLFILLTFTMTL